MNKKKSIIQFLVGFTPIFLLWCIGAYTYMSHFDNFNIDPNHSPYYLVVPVIAVILIPFFLLIFAIVCKRKSLNHMYIGALLATGLPVLASILSPVFSDDGNILSWIYAFTIGLVLYPFGRVAFETFQGISGFYFTFTEQKFIEEETINFVLVAAIIISAILFKVIKAPKGRVK